MHKLNNITANILIFVNFRCYESKEINFGEKISQHLLAVLELHIYLWTNCSDE